MNISVIGTGYVGLVTGVCLSEIGHYVSCIDIDEQKVNLLNNGIVPLFEPGLDHIMEANVSNGRLRFTSDYEAGLAKSDVVYIAVGTPRNNDGSTNLAFIEQAAKNIAVNLSGDTIVVIKSTVPIGTNQRVKHIIESHLKARYTVHTVSNPEFLREGSAVHDTFFGDRIVIGADNEKAAEIIEEINRPFNIPVFKTDIRSAEMIKYASNAFLAAKISFINEIANLCERVGADVEDVAAGMGRDGRIGEKFLDAGVGYGGSCFPKDTQALLKIAESAQYEFNLLKSVVQVNERQQTILVKKAKERFGSLAGMKVALLGLTFKANTDDMRESPAIRVSELLIREGAQVVAFDPVGTVNARKVLHPSVSYAANLDSALSGADFAMLLTDWRQVTESLLPKAGRLMKRTILFDGRNCFTAEEAKRSFIEYYSVGRAPVTKAEVLYDIG